MKTIAKNVMTYLQGKTRILTKEREIKIISGEAQRKNIWIRTKKNKRIDTATDKKTQSR